MLNHPKVAASIVLALMSVFGVASYFSSLNKELYNRFPDIDRKVIRKAKKRFLVVAAKGGMNIEDLNPSEIDKIFLQEVKAVQKAA